MTEPHNRPAQGGQAPTAADSFKCPHCGHAYVVQIRAREVVTIGKCPNCGELIAPAKNN